MKTLVFGLIMLLTNSLNAQLIGALYADSLIAAGKPTYFLDPVRFSRCVDSINAMPSNIFKVRFTGCFWNDGEQDSLRNHNRRTREFLDSQNGAGWTDSLVSRVYACDKSLCPEISANGSVRIIGNDLTGYVFNFNSSKPDQEMLCELKAVAYAFNKHKADYPNLRLHVSAYADSNEARPKDLATDRARAIRDFLIHCGVNAELISASGDIDRQRILYEYDYWRRRLAYLTVTTE